ncbi:MAG: rhodanese-like domain-containing protein [Clostridia bacterium]
MLKTIKKFLSRSINKDINYKTATKLLKENDGVLLDVRSKQEYEEIHLPGAINISLYNLKGEAIKKLPDKNKIIVVYCASGSRSKQAQNILEQMNYQNVYNLKNGINAI